MQLDWGDAIDTQVSWTVRGIDLAGIGSVRVYPKGSGWGGWYGLVNTKSIVKKETFIHTSYIKMPENTTHIRRKWRWAWVCALYESISTVRRPVATERPVRNLEERCLERFNGSPWFRSPRGQSVPDQEGGTFEPAATTVGKDSLLAVNPSGSSRRGRTFEGCGGFRCG